MLQLSPYVRESERDSFQIQSIFHRFRTRCNGGRSLSIDFHRSGKIGGEICNASWQGTGRQKTVTLSELNLAPLWVDRKRGPDDLSASKGS